MAYKCMIVDDEPLARKVIREYLDDVHELSLGHESGSPIEAIEILKRNEIDVLFLDINMPKLDGFQVLNQLKEPPIVIFTTAYSEYAVKAFEVKAFDYLVKPISFERFLQSCNRVVAHLAGNNDEGKDEPDAILIKENKRLYRISPESIYYIKAFGDYIRIFTDTKTYIVKDRLQKFSKELNDRFLKVHRSYVVNLDHIHYLEGNHLVIDDKKIPVSETYRNELINRI
ncbi:MAG: response regulator transcription factor [Saprospiraceae bacterium]|nr:response regulator transcription factor [Saprospiraceae bacterium]